MLRQEVAMPLADLPALLHLDDIIDHILIQVWEHTRKRSG